jgi:protein-tyrosine phosphatase
MRSLAFEGVETVVSLLDPDEASWLGLTDEAKLASQAGLQFLSFPIHDHSLPSDPAAFQNFVAGLAERVRNGERIGVHCLGSIGRAPLTTACTLIELGYKAPDALEAVERARRCPVPDTEEQAQWILHYKARA